MSEYMRCTKCYYAHPVYGKDGLQIGIECSKDNMRFIEMDIARTMYCGAFAEADE